MKGEIEQSMEPQGSLAEARAALAGFEELRQRSALTGAHAARGRGSRLGFLRRLWRRLRDLGPVWDRESVLWRTSFELHGIEHQRSAETTARAARTASGLEDVVRRLDVVVRRLDEVAFDVAHGRDLAADRGRLLEDRLVAADGRAREALGSARLLRRELDLQAGDRPLTPSGFTAALQELEATYPRLRSCSAIDVSAQSVRDEDLVRAADAFFGDRLSARGPSYRAPNDAWIHVDFTPWSDRPILAENAAGRLSEGGLFVLLTGAPGEHPGAHPKLRMVASRALEAPAAIALQALVWERV